MGAAPLLGTLFGSRRARAHRFRQCTASAHPVSAGSTLIIIIRRRRRRRRRRRVHPVSGGSRPPLLCDSLQRARMTRARASFRAPRRSGAGAPGPVHMCGFNAPGNLSVLLLFKKKLRGRIRMASSHDATFRLFVDLLHFFFNGGGSEWPLSEKYRANDTFSRRHDARSAASGTRRRSTSPRRRRAHKAIICRAARARNDARVTRAGPPVARGGPT